MAPFGLSQTAFAIINVLCTIFIIICIINYDKFFARFEKNKKAYLEKRVNAPEEYLKKIDELLKS